MRALAVANTFIAGHGSELMLTNLVLNKLVYYAQVESLRRTGRPLFDDPIQAWQYGPVEEEVYATFSSHGRGRITAPVGQVADDAETSRIVAGTVERYGFLTAFDLVAFSHREGSAWRNVYVPGRRREITVEDILASDDGVVLPEKDGTFASNLDDVSRKWPNTFRMLRNA